jgi:hypothetical protein
MQIGWLGRRSMRAIREDYGYTIAAWHSGTGPSAIYQLP